MNGAAWRSGGLAVGLVVLTAALLTAAVPDRLTAQDTTAGKVVYVKWCAGCHGDQGDGKGEAANYMLPRPRDFTGAIYKIRTTASGQLPTDADLMRAIDEGLPGTAMPAWKSRLSESERRNVMAYLHCFKCHGQQGRGDGPSAPDLHDDPGQPIFAADLHQNWRFRGGPTVGDIYRRLRTGLDATPMPSFSDLIDKKFLTDEQLWRLAQYVRSLSPDRPPEVRDVIHARQVVGALPASPDDSTWGPVDRYYFPLVGQVIRKPRWFAPAVTAVWVQAVHNGKELAVRLTWDDRSQSPDTAWNKYTRRLLVTLAGDDSTPVELAPWPDQVALQFPRTIPEGTERPYFLMGSETGPVYQWRWTSAPRRAVAGLARGVERFDTLPAKPAAQAVWDHGQWRLVFTRALATADTANELQFAVGRAIPVAFFAWDGSSAERDARMAVSTWYFLALDQPTPPGTFISPVIAMAVTLGLGMLVVVRAQRRAGRA